MPTDPNIHDYPSSTVALWEQMPTDPKEPQVTDYERERDKRIALENNLNGPMAVYRIEIGATYYVLAHNAAEALSTAWKTWIDDEGCGRDDCEIGGIRIDPVPQEKWPETYWDDGDGKHRSFAALVDKQTAPTVLTCSEW